MFTLKIESPETTYCILALLCGIGIGMKVRVSIEFSYISNSITLVPFFAFFLLFVKCEKLNANARKIKKTDKIRHPASVDIRQSTGNKSHKIHTCILLLCSHCVNEVCMVCIRPAVLWRKNYKSPGRDYNPQLARQEVPTRNQLLVAYHSGAWYGRQHSWSQ